MRQAVVDLGSQPITNLHYNPVGEFNSNGYGVPNGSTISRVPEAKIIGAGSVGLRVYCPAGGISDMGLSVNINVVAGQTYTWSGWFRAVTAGSYKHRTSGVFGTVNAPALDNMVAGEVRRISVTATAQSTGMGIWYILRSNDTERTFDVHAVMLTEGPGVPVYADGDTPGWRWTGTTRNSISVGYPYTLESIAGKPVYFAENVVASTTYVKDLTPGGPYTVAACQQVPGTTNSPGLWLISEQASNQARRLLAAGAGTPVFRMDPFRTDGSLGAQSTSSANPTVKHVSVTRVRAGTQPMDMMLNGGNLLSPTFPDTGVAFRPMTITPVRFAVGTRDGLVQSEAPTTYGIAVWEADLNVETMKRVSAWFARKYDTPIPAGY